MKDPKVRLLYSSDVRPAEVHSALKGAMRFRRFGLDCDSFDVSTKGAFEDVKSARAINNIFAQNGPVVIDRSTLVPDIWEFLSPKGITPLALLPSQLLPAVDYEHTTKLEPGPLSGPYRTNFKPVDYEHTPKFEPRLGFALRTQGALISLAKIRELSQTDPARAGSALELAVAHELGYVFGRAVHCMNGSCLMKKNHSFEDFLTRFVDARVDFCRDCVYAIRQDVNSLIAFANLA